MLPVEAVVEPNEDVAYEVWVVEDATEFVGHSADDVQHHQPLPPDALLDAALGPRPNEQAGRNPGRGAEVDLVAVWLRVSTVIIKAAAQPFLCSVVVGRMMSEQQHEPTEAADAAPGAAGVGSAASAPEASDTDADRAEQDLRTQVARIRADAADAIRPGRAP